MKKTIIAYGVVVLIAFIACVYIAMYVTKAIADDSKDFSWASRIMEEREGNNIVIAEKTSELYNLEMELKKLKERNSVITCKLEKGDRDATCSL